MNSAHQGIRIMSFNIRCENPNDGANSWDNRKHMAASMLRFHQIDMAGLQEVRRNQLDEFLTRLPEYSYIGVGRDDGETGGEYTPILYRKGRFIPLSQGTFWLSQTPDVKGSMGWDASYRRIVTWGSFKDVSTQKVFYLFNTHFDNDGETAQKESADLLIKKVDEIAGKHPVVVTGDFNVTDTSLTYEILTSQLTDSRHCAVLAHHGPTITFHAFKGTDYIRGHLQESNLLEMYGQETYAWIDYIFVKNKVKVRQEGVLADHWDGRYPSDHMPIISDIDLD